MKHKIYVKTIVSILFSLVLVSFVINWIFFNFENIEGDLTRIGMHSEYDFGNNGEEHFFENPPSKKGKIGDIEVYDIVVIGDSFSNHRFSYAWHNYLSKKTGLNVGVFKIKSQKEVIKAINNAKNPPGLVVYESVERELYTRFGSQNNKCKPTPSAFFNRYRLKPKKINTIYTTRDRSFSFKVDLGVKFLKSAIMRKNLQETKILDIVTTDLFTNKKADKLLVYAEDIEKKKNLTTSNWENIWCGLLELQNQVQKTQKTNFVALIAPDKLTIYSPYLKSNKWKNISNYQQHLNNNLNVVLLMPYFENAISKGYKDLYLPNDTHWGSSGNKLVGGAVLDYLKKTTVIVE